MHSVLTGAYGGEYDIHLYFVNAVYACFLKPFYVLFPNVGWFSLFEVATVLASFSAISYVLIKKNGNKLGGVLALLLLICVSLDFYLRIEFTKCAGVAVAAGIVLFIEGNNERRWRYLVLGCLFMLIAAVFRKEMFLLGMPTFAVLLFSQIVKNRCIWLWSVVTLVVFATAFIGLKEFDLNLYKGNEYEHYVAYQKPRAFFGDGKFFDAKAFSDELDERGIGSRNYRYLRAWYFYDKNVFSLDSMERLVSIAQRNVYEPNYLKMPFAVVLAVSDSFYKCRAWCWVLLCFAIIYFSNRKYWWVPWVSFALISVPYTYLLLVNRVMDHVESGIWLLAIVFILFFIDKNDIIGREQTKRFFLATLLVCFGGVACTGTMFVLDNRMRETRMQKDGTPDWKAFLQYTQERNDDVFLLPVERYMQLAETVGRIYKAPPPHSLDNIYSTGYWNIYLPSMERELEKRDVTNMFHDIKNDNVYVVSDKQSLSFVPFYNEHYHEKLVADTIRTFGCLRLLKYRLEEKYGEQIAQ